MSRPGRFHYVIQCYRAAVAAAQHYADRQDHRTAERFWRDADGWRRYAHLNGLDLEGAAA